QIVQTKTEGNLLSDSELPKGVSVSDRPARVMLRITPGIECHTHEYIKTGHLDSKFGFDLNQMPRVLEFATQHPEIQWIGLHAHIGSQIFEVVPHRDLAAVLVDWFIAAQKLGLPMAEVNVGGGLGVRYTEQDDPPTIQGWSRVVCDAMASACRQQNLAYPKLICEPGRSLIASACVTAYTVGARKEVPDIRTYLSVDGGMSDNPRPITYQSDYSLVLANQMSAPVTEVATIAGKHCESGDILIKDANVPRCDVGDTLVFLATGAYNYSMSSNYNRIPRPAAVLAHEGQANLFLQRETYHDLIRHDRMPARLQQCEM
ncbi:MAG: diaminopimelate decarboxylase, partial [Cyanobacteria bacterium P01_F01_bin.42]